MQKCKRNVLLATPPYFFVTLTFPDEYNGEWRIIFHTNAKRAIKIFWAQKFYFFYFLFFLKKYFFLVFYSKNKDKTILFFSETKWIAMAFSTILVHKGLVQNLLKILKLVTLVVSYEANKTKIRKMFKSLNFCDIWPLPWGYNSIGKERMDNTSILARTPKSGLKKFFFHPPPPFKIL